MLETKALVKLGQLAMYIACAREANEDVASIALFSGFPNLPTALPAAARDPLATLPAELRAPPAAVAADEVVEPVGFAWLGTFTGLLVPAAGLPALVFPGSFGVRACWDWGVVIRLP